MRLLLRYSWGVNRMGGEGWDGQNAGVKSR